MASQEAVQSLPNLNEIKAVPQFEMVKVHGDKLLEHSIVERKEQQTFISSTTSTGPMMMQELRERPINVEREEKDRVFIKTLDEVPVNENDELQWRTSTQKAYTERMPINLQLYPNYSDEQRQQQNSQLQRIIDENKFKQQGLKKGAIETKIFNIYDPMFSCARADIWSHSEVLSFGREPGRIFKLQHQLFPGASSNIRSGIAEIKKRDEEELVDPITSAIHCAAMEAKLKFKSVRASHDICEMWRTSQFKQQEIINDNPVQLRSNFGGQVLNQSQIMLGNQKLQLANPIIVQKPMSSNFATSPGTTTRNVQVTRVEERIDIQEQTVPVVQQQQQQQQLPIQQALPMQQQQQPMIVNAALPTTAATNTVMLPQQAQPILAHVQPGTFLEEQIIGAKPVLQQAPPSRL